jgi:hypothetical protein
VKAFRVQKSIAEKELLFIAILKRLIGIFQPVYHLLSTMARDSREAERSSNTSAAGYQLLLCSDSDWINTSWLQFFCYINILGSFTIYLMITQAYQHKLLYLADIEASWLKQLPIRNYQVIF